MELMVNDLDLKKQAFQSFRRKLDEWEFVVEGNWYGSPDHGGRNAFYVGHDPTKQMWGLEQVDLGPGGRRRRYLTAVLFQPEERDESEIVRLLMKTSEAGIWSGVDEVSTEGRFDLEEPAPKKSATMNRTS